MSGTFTHRVNRLWDVLHQTDMSVPAFFWEWLKYVQDHAGLSFVNYGTGKVISGSTTPPAAWIDDFDPETDPNPYGDNSWFVFQADNADPLLDGGGGMPWQAKIQMTTTTGFDDCNVADVDHGEEGTTWCVCIRCSVGGGWDAVTDLEFEPVGGEDISQNHVMMTGQNVNYILDIIGDDDTIFWDGACFSGALSNADSRSRGGYLGMLIRRSDVITYPFLMTIGRMYDGGPNTERNAINRCSQDDDSQWERVAGTTSLSPGFFRWPTYTLWKDKTKIEGANIHAHDCWHPDDLWRMTPDPATGDMVIPACLAAQYQNPNKYAILGELRLIGATAFEFDHGVVVGTDSNWRQFCYNATVDSGMLMQWPQGVTAIWT